MMVLCREIPSAIGISVRVESSTDDVSRCARRQWLTGKPPPRFALMSEATAQLAAKRRLFERRRRRRRLDRRLASPGVVLSVGVGFGLDWRTAALALALPGRVGVGCVRAEWILVSRYYRSRIWSRIRVGTA